MTSKQVRDNFVQNLAENAYLNMCTVEEMEIAISALEKQIRKKPLKQECDFFDFILVCPKCKNRIVNVWSKRQYKPNYCHYCGQALDWNDDNG